jgi:hypothetical protein
MLVEWADVPQMSGIVTPISSSGAGRMSFDGISKRSQEKRTTYHIVDIRGFHKKGDLMEERC